jgi:hypothetical protein
MYLWMKYLHIASVMALLATHGVSIVVMYRIRGERDRKRILDLITFSGETIVPMYISIAAIVVTGVWAGLIADWFRYAWIWISLVVLVATIGLMTVTAKPYFARVKEACQVRPSGVPRTSDEELGEILRSGRAHLVTAIGLGGLLGILYLMVFKPGVG